MSISTDPLRTSDVVLGIPVSDMAASSDAYRILLGEPFDAGVWTFGNGRVELLPGDAEAAVDFAVADLHESVRLLGRRGLAAVLRDETSYELEGVEPVGITVRNGRGDGPRVDHVVMYHHDVDAAVALYAGRLGMDLRLDRQIAEGVAQLFFRTSSVIVEVVAGPSMADRDRFGGVAWLVDDIDAEQHRLVDAGLDVSEVRIGRKPGTRVCTLRDRAFGTPTLLIEQTPKP
ncbi:Glyoxalase/Bleomycin resistance protein/Dioxygenase superfamily protein [Gordonia malaquae]|uniref:VOC domain-containing protein n=1 Tax=Gordonia malaquae NBRC 108250 TaxID=1223542 RepID=M3VA30_GORML|nr:VOC family protein [Gordonia malaquae]GAC78478.1 hypothetical protein GM1_003_02170 [Gordonia malaquae NBRC 108250]SED40286.1 Glyoxalase/Bleomycin resistance protein/Dioxygenase superfamily protein [Gordonia malaquae]